MFGLGAGEIFLIGILALVFVGPKKLPELARGLGKGIREFQKAKDDLLNEVRGNDFSEETGSISNTTIGNSGRSTDESEVFSVSSTKSIPKNSEEVPGRSDQINSEKGNGSTS